MITPKSIAELEALLLARVSRGADSNLLPDAQAAYLVCLRGAPEYVALVDEAGIDREAWLDGGGWAAGHGLPESWKPAGHLLVDAALTLGATARLLDTRLGSSPGGVGERSVDLALDLCGAWGLPGTPEVSLESENPLSFASHVTLLLGNVSLNRPSVGSTVQTVRQVMSDPWRAVPPGRTPRPGSLNELAFLACRETRYGAMGLHLEPDAVESIHSYWTAPHHVSLIDPEYWPDFSVAILAAARLHGCLARYHTAHAMAMAGGRAVQCIRGLLMRTAIDQVGALDIEGTLQPMGVIQAPSNFNASDSSASVC